MTQQAIDDTKTGALPEETEESSEEGVRSRPWEEHELRELFREEINAAFNATRADAQRVQAMLPQLEEVTGSTKRLESFIKNFVKGTLTDEQYSELEKADQLARAQADQAKAEARAKVLETAQSQNDGGRAMAWHHVKADVQSVVEQEGVSEDTALSLQPKALGSQTARDPFGYIAHKDEWIKDIRAYSDKQKKEEKPKPEIITARGNGAGVIDWNKAHQLAKEGKLPDEALEKLLARE